MDIFRSMAKKILGTKMTKHGLKTRIECNRCNGTGNWDPNGYRVCYKCGGYGEILEGNASTDRAAKLEHIAEVKGLLADEERHILTARFGKKQIQERINAHKANLILLEAELEEMH